MSADWEQVALFDQHLDQLADEAGVELTDEDRALLFRQSLEGGFDPDSTVAAFDSYFADGGRGRGRVG